MVLGDIFYSIRRNFSRERAAGLGSERRAGVRLTEGEKILLAKERACAKALCPGEGRH